MNNHEKWLANQLNQYKRKKLLSPYYYDIFSRIRTCLISDNRPTLEIGTGCGISRITLADLDFITSDAIKTDYCDLVVDAQVLPFPKNSIANIFAVDVLHHLPSPFAFLAESERVLIQGGRIVLVEPAITPVSWFFYKFLHKEGMKWNIELDSLGRYSQDDLMDANNALPSKIFINESIGELKKFGLHLKYETKLFSGMSMLLTGGINSNLNLQIPRHFFELLIRIEDSLPKPIKKAFFFRTLIVIEKS